MKKIYFVMLAIAATLFVSCMQQEQPFDDLKLGENDVVFTFGSVDTKSADIQPLAIKGVSIPLSDDGMGNGFSLEETIEELNPSPMTKGTPAYTFNVGKIYKTMNVYADQGSFGGEATYSVKDYYDNKEASLGKGWRYTYSYSGNPWPDETTPVDFYFNMPVDVAGLSDPDYSNGKTTFTFDSPTNGAAQQDILFSHTAVSKEEHDGYLPYGTPVLMYHALTGVKFRNGHSNDGSTKTIIKSVKFTGLYSHGICTVTPGATEGVSKDKVEWKNQSTAKSFTLTFDEPEYDPEAGADNPDGTINYGTDSQFSGTSWTAAAADQNLKDEDGSLTFWFIPQTIGENVTLEVTFTIKTPDTEEGQEFTHIIEFGKLINGTTTDPETGETTTHSTTWKAGQLRTYTVKPFDVDVEIFDRLTNLTKDNLHVTNTGNVDEYVRIMVIGNWYGWKPGQSHSEEPSIMVGYISDGTDGDDTMVEPWYREDPVYAAGFDETFPGGRPLASSHWKRGTGSYFYYDQVIGAGQQLSGTEALFQHYELTESMIPTIYIPVANQTTRVPAEGVHLVMEVVVQAIPTTKPDGTAFATCWEAWSYAVGKEIKAK